MRNKLFITLVVLFGFFQLKAQDTITFISGNDTTIKIVNNNKAILPQDTTNKIILTLRNERLIGEKIIFLKGKSATQIFNATKEWVAYSFMNTKSVTQSFIKNKMVRITAISPGVLNLRTLGSQMGGGLKYNIQIDIKDEKLRFNVYDIEGQNGGVLFHRFDVAFFKNGELRTWPLYQREYKVFKKQAEDEFTKLLNSLLDKINNNSGDSW